jgi:hypothetical protein
MVSLAVTARIVYRLGPAAAIGNLVFLLMFACLVALIAIYCGLLFMRDDDGGAG